MDKLIKRFIVGAYVLMAAGCGVSVSAATCSRLNLTRCLDAVCATNVGANPAARCQLCGDSMAGSPADTGLRAVLGGTGYSLTEQQLRAAPVSQGARYAWAADECIKKVPGCTVDDVFDEYDKLIEQSCKAVCVNADILARQSAAMTASKSADECLDSVRVCVTSDSRCGADFANCESEVIDRHISECSVTAGNLCATYNADIRRTITNSRNSVVAARANIVETVAASHRARRDSELAAARGGCADNQSRNACVTRTCGAMPGKCEDRFEQSAAELMCAYETVACSRLN